MKTTNMKAFGPQRSKAIAAADISERYKMLQTVCETDTLDFASPNGNLPNPPNYTVWDTPHGPLIHIDNGGSILAVGHLDDVVNQSPIITDSHIWCGQLDDRLGVWGLLHGLKDYTDVKYDILLCDSEEQGQSTAQYFSSDDVGKHYRWGFELDRAGTDCVLYDFEGHQLESDLRDSGWNCNMGAFSDISSLTGQGCQFVNFGIGYHGQHGENCHAKLSDVESQLDRIGQFITAKESTEYPFDESMIQPFLRGGHYDTYYKKDYQDDFDYSDSYYTAKPARCGCPEMADGHPSDWTFCPHCGLDLYCR